MEIPLPLTILHSGGNSFPGLTDTGHEEKYRLAYTGLAGTGMVRFTGFLLKGGLFNS